MSDAPAIQYNSEQRIVTYGDSRAYLTQGQAAVFAHIAGRSGGVVSHGAVQRIVDPLVQREDARRLVSVFVCNINRILRESWIPAAIENVYSTGYRITAPIEFLKSPEIRTIGRDDISVIRRLISACRDPELAEEATQVFIDQ